jgi:hypothetical protein
VPAQVHLDETLTITDQLAGLPEHDLRWKVWHDFLKANGKKTVTLSLERTLLDMTSHPGIQPPGPMGL